MSLGRDVYVRGKRQACATSRGSQCPEGKEVDIHDETHGDSHGDGLGEYNADDDGCLALFAQPGLLSLISCWPQPRCLMMMMTLRRNTNKGVGKVKVIMLMIIMKTYQVPCSQGQKSTLVLHLLKKRPEAFSYCCWRR